MVRLPSGANSKVSSVPNNPHSAARSLHIADWTNRHTPVSMRFPPDLNISFSYSQHWLRPHDAAHVLHDGRGRLHRPLRARGPEPIHDSALPGAAFQPPGHHRHVDLHRRHLHLLHHLGSSWTHHLRASPWLRPHPRQGTKRVPLTVGVFACFKRSITSYYRGCKEVHFSNNSRLLSHYVMFWAS